MKKNIEETARELTSLVAGRIYNLNFNIREVENSLRVRHGVLSHAKNKTKKKGNASLCPSYWQPSG